MEQFGLMMCLGPKTKLLELTPRDRDKLRATFRKEQPCVVTFLEEYGEDYMSIVMAASSVEIALLLHYIYTSNGATPLRVKRGRLEYHLQRNQELMDNVAVANAKKLPKEADALYQTHPQPTLRGITYNEVWQLHRNDEDDNPDGLNEGAFERQVQIEDRMQVLLGAVLDSFDEVATESPSVTTHTTNKGTSKAKRNQP